MGDEWVFPLVTGHRYRFHFGEANDITTMKITLGQLWNEDDNTIDLMTNFTDVRVAMNLTMPNGELIPNETYSLKSREELAFGDNVIYNQTEVREYYFALNAKNETRGKVLNFEGFRCVVNCELPEVEEAEIAESPVPWSDPFSWPSGAVPKEGEDVEIPPGAWIEFDLEESPLIRHLTINGRLSFKNDPETPVDRTLLAYIIFVRAGELVIGSEEEPYNGVATIRLHGTPNDETIAYSYVVEGGNKGILNVGLVKMFGKERTGSYMTRLRESVFKNDKKAVVYPALDWVAGDQVALLPTATQWTHTDYMTIESYDPMTGEVSFTEGLKYYHYGKSSTTAGDYSGVDMRGEVVLLTRNVRVVGNDTDSWGAQMVTSDTVEMSGKERTGQIILKDVECYNCTQRNTYKAGIRIEDAKTLHHEIYNCAVWGGLAWPFAVFKSKNVDVRNSYFIGGRQIGVFVGDGTSNVTMDQIVTADIQRRPEMIHTMANMIDKEGCVAICSLFNTADPNCYDNKITNSISAGCVYAGFVVPGHDCGDSDNNDSFRDNIAHSMEQGGAYIYPNIHTSSHHKTCYEGSHFAAYKCGMTGAGAHFVTQEIRFTNMVMIDNTLGINVLTSGETDHQLSVLTHSDIYGSAGSDDCPAEHDCWCRHKHGIQTFGGNMGTKAWHIDAASPLPMQHIMSYGSWAASTDFYKVNFKKWLSGT